MKITLSILLMFITTSVYAHEDPLQIPWPKGEKVPCRCDILAIDYEQCLKGIGAEECFKVVEPKEPRCSPNVKPGTVVQTFPPTYNCEDLKRKNSLEARVKELEEKIRKLEKD
tara:strand:+ start:505 stop:843 length:339 start_codon:yes stop_codon:yes gene_type:complete